MAEEPLFIERNVSWILDGIEMEGTITCPRGNGKHAGIIFVAGSGPTDRNWCSPLLPGTNGSAKPLAEELSKNGYATLRFDKRASGPRIRDNVKLLVGKISMQSHIDEVAAAVQAFVDSGVVEEDKIFALTNSEGVIHALNYQLQGRKPLFDGFILTGVPGRSVEEVAREQILNQSKNLENSDELIRLYDQAIADFIEGKDVNIDASLPESAQMLIKGLTSPANLPFSRELWLTNPTDLVKNIEAPVLIVIGKKDLQIDWKADGEKLEKFTEGKSNVTIRYPDNADHVLKYEEKPREDLIPEKVGLSYNAVGRTIDSKTLDLIISWLNENTRRSRS